MRAKSIIELNGEIERLEGSISRVHKGSKYTTADRKVLIPFYKARLKEVNAEKFKALKKLPVFDEEVVTVCKRDILAEIETMKSVVKNRNTNLDTVGSYYREMVVGKI